MYVVWYASTENPELHKYKVSAGVSVQCVYEYINVVCYCSQLAMFMQLMEQQPELAEALSDQMAIVKVEIKRQEKLKALKVSVALTTTALRNFYFMNYDDCLYCIILLCLEQRLCNRSTLPRRVC